MGVCNCSMFCYMLLYVRSSIAIILMGKRELVALLNLSSWCLVMVERLFLAVPRGCLQFVNVVFPDHTHLLFLNFTPIVGLCNCSLFCKTLLYVHPCFEMAIFSMGKRELAALLCLTSWCLVIVVWFFLTMTRVCLQVCDCGIS